MAGMLGQFARLAHLDLADNSTGAEGAERLADVLGQCSRLADLNRNYDSIREEEGGV